MATSSRASVCQSPRRLRQSAINGVTEFWDICPDQFTQEQLEAYFSSLVEPHS
ncbi:hypothetical protein [Spongiibacter thalassae]|uniref:hypothetical protein n=1 Tax=Spongiibacter thalassae TaxID=2721624 RepID=UPI001FF0D0C1|nr:hypothetical protein [Spongiibacter thalassae]